MDPPPFTRFRLRVEILPPQDGRNVSTDPLCKFTIVKTAAIPLPDLTVRQLLDEVVERFKSMYPDKPLFTIDRSQDSRGYDLHLEDRVREVFADLEVLKIVQGSTRHALGEPHRTRSASVQAIEFPVEESLTGQKRRIESPDIHISSQTDKRRRTSYRDADRPIRSRERDFDAQKEGSMGDGLQQASLVQDSQPSLVVQGQNQGRRAQIQFQSSLPVLEVSESIQKIDGIYKDIQSPNAGRKPAARLQPIDSPLGAGKSRNGSLASGPDAQPHMGSRPSLNRTLLFYDEGNNVDNPNSTSIAATTPPSAKQQLDPSLLVFDNNKLKRPNRAAVPGRDGGAKTPRAVPRKDIYDDVGSDLERPRVKSATPIGRKALSKLKQPSPPVGVSKWKAFVQKGPSSEDGSFHTQRGNDVNGNDVGQDEANLTRGEQQRLDQENQDTANPVTRRAGQSGIIAKAAEEKRHLMEAKAKELKATVSRNKPANDAEEKDREKAREEAHAAGAESELHLQLHLEVEANEKHEEAQRPNPDRQTRLQKQRGGQTSFRSPTIRPNGMLSRAIAAHENSTASEVDSNLSAVTPKSAHLQATPASQRSSSTAFIPRGRPSGIMSVAMNSSQIIGSSSPAETSPRRRIQTPVPPPVGVKRKVSFIEPQTQQRAARKASTPSSSLKQTTLVEPRLGITDVKSTPKRNVNRAASSGSESSKSNKGKAKVVEPPAKQQEVIVIPSDTELSSVGYNEDNFRSVGEPGPAYQKNSRRLSSRTSQSKVDGRGPNESAILPKRPPPPYPVIIKLEPESSLEPSSLPLTKSLSQVLRGRSSPRGLRSHVTPYSPILPPGTRGQNAVSHASASRFNDNSPAKIAATRLNGVIHSPVTGISNIPINVIDVDGVSEDEEEQDSDDSSEAEDEDDEATEADKTIKTAVAAAGNGAATMAARNQYFNEKEEDDNVESDETGEDETIKHGQVMVNSNELTGEESVEDESSSEYETDEGGQTQLGNQLILPAQQQDSQRQKRLDTSTSRGRSITKNEDTEQLREHSAKRPSLRRITEEAERTRDADRRAAEARGIAKAQKERDAAGQASEMEGTDEDLSSSTPENDDDEEVETDMIPKVPSNMSSGRKATESSRSSALLGSEDAEEVRKDLEPRMTARYGVSSQRTVDPQVNGRPRKVNQSSQKKRKGSLAQLGKKFAVKNKSGPRG